MSAITRRTALITAISAALIVNAQTGAHAMTDAELDRHRHDWDWLQGSWRVRHHRLKERLMGSTEWQDFDGTCTMVRTMDGLGNMDDNWLDLPADAYRAMGIRAFNPETWQWSIWWLDGRVQTIDPPVRGGFANSVGTFEGDDVLSGQPIRVRFRWTDINTETPHWEQAFSPDGGATWEVNWQMEFRRV